MERKPDSSPRALSRRRPLSRAPEFTPVPLRPRADGWTPLRQADFLGALAETGSVGQAAERAGMSRESAYRLRGRPGAESFAAAWDAILARPGRDLPKVTYDALWRRAMGGTLRPLMRGGRHVGTLASHDDDALFRLLGRGARDARAPRGKARRSQ